MKTKVEPMGDKWEREFDKLCPCIQHGCTDGVIANQVGEDEWEPQQCEYCYKIRFPTKDFIRSLLASSVQEAKAEGRKEMDWEWTKVHEVFMREQAERIMSELDIVWVCPPCAKKFFNRGYTEGKTNVSTAMHRQCEACHEYNQCMHHRSYDLLTSLRKGKI